MPLSRTIDYAHAAASNFFQNLIIPQKPIRIATMHVAKQVIQRRVYAVNNVIVPNITNWSFSVALTGLAPGISHTFRVAASLVATNGLGIDVAAPEAVLRAQLGLEENVGLVVTAVPEESLGGKAGLKPHDVIVQLNDQKIGDAAKLAELLDAARGQAIFRHGGLTMKRVRMVSGRVVGLAVLLVLVGGASCRSKGDAAARRATVDTEAGATADGYATTRGAGRSAHGRRRSYQRRSQVAVCQL